MVAPTAIIRGIGMTFGLDLVESPGATGYYDSDLNMKAETCANKLMTDEKYNFGFIHIKGVDDAGHDKSLEIKI